MCPNALHFREFQNDPVTGWRYHGTCGETALATALVCATPQIESTQEAINLMMAMTREMMAKNWADKPNGNSRTQTLMWEAKARGFTVASPYDQWEDPIPSAKLHPWLLQYAGVMPIVLMVTHAGEGLTAVDGSHAERGVQGHFICVVGIADEGYVVNDGDNNVIADHLVIYPWSAIEKAHVTGFLMIELMQGAQKVAVPASWKDLNGVITAPNDIQVVRGFADYIRKNAWEDDDWPLEAERGVSSVELGNPQLGAGVIQLFRKRQMTWTQDKGAFETWTGQELQATQQALATAQAQAKALLQQIADLQAKAALSPQQQADLLVMTSLRAALKAN